MNIEKIKLDFIDVLESDLKMLSHALSSNLAHKISDEMAQEYQYVIERFYGEYTPKYYKRHSERGMVAGMFKTFKKHYKNAHNTIYYGGIEISSEKMYNDYHDSKDEVLGSFLDGYHGRASLGIGSSVLPYKHMLTFRKLLMKELEHSDSALFSYAKNKAKGLPYKLIQIK